MRDAREEPGVYPLPRSPELAIWPELPIGPWPIGQNWPKYQEGKNMPNAQNGKGRPKLTNGQKGQKGQKGQSIEVRISIDLWHMALDERTPASGRIEVLDS